MQLPKAYATSVRKRAIDMTLSVNPLGCSPRALRAVRTMTNQNVSLYPNTAPLIAALSRKFRVPENGILLGNGSELLIKLISQTFIKPGDLAAVESGSFFLFSKEPTLTGGTVRFFDFTTARRMKRAPSLLFIANPTTPGGINRTNKQLCRVMDILRPAVAVVDEANGEFRNETMITEIGKRRNLIVLRTFSKAYGLAGLRIGMAFGNPRLIAKMGELLQPFPVTSPALTAALAALADDAFLDRTRDFVASERIRITKALTKRGFVVSDSITNNLFAARKDSKAIIRRLENLGVSVIDGAFFPGNKTPGFRISVKDRQTNIRFLKALDKALACVSKNNLLPSKEIL